MVRDPHKRLMYRNHHGVFWKGEGVSCFVDGCEGKPGVAPRPKCAHIVFFEDE